MAEANIPRLLVITATTFPASTATPTDAWVGVGAIFPASVTKPLTCTVANGGTEGTLTVSGGDVSPTTLLCDGSPHDFTAEASSTLTLTVPSDGTNTRYRFAGGVTTATVSTCSSGTCSGASGTVYYQLQNTFDAKPELPTTWDYTGTSDVAATGTVAGSGARPSAPCPPRAAGQAPSTALAGQIMIRRSVSAPWRQRHGAVDIVHKHRVGHSERRREQLHRLWALRQAVAGAVGRVP